jgi:hypothetical protein
MKDFELGGKYYDFALNGDIKKGWYLGLGNWTDAGWRWSGDETSMAGFLVRMATSAIKQQFIDDFNKAEIPFDEIKELAIIAIQEHKNGVYEISGDNNRWRFGNDDCLVINPEEEIQRLSNKKLTLDSVHLLTHEQWGSILITASENTSTSYDDFEGTTEYDRVKGILLECFVDADSLETLLNGIDHTLYEIDEIVGDWKLDQFYSTLDETMLKAGVKPQVLDCEGQIFALPSKGINPSIVVSGSITSDKFLTRGTLTSLEQPRT